MKCWKQPIVLVLIAALFFATWCIVERNRYNMVSSEEIELVRQKLIHLSLQEREALSGFFTRAIYWDEYAYPLVEHKPMSVCNYFQESEDLPVWANEIYQNPRSRKYSDSMKQGFDVWKKYEGLFPLKKYQIIRYPRSISKGVVVIALIHTELCNKEMLENYHDFQGVCGEDVPFETISQIFVFLEHPKFYEVMENERLLGILLGFGRDNAYRYQQKERNR